MNARTPNEPAGHIVRPLGTWAVAGFLAVAIVVTWVLVAIIFHARS